MSVGGVKNVCDKLGAFAIEFAFTYSRIQQKITRFIWKRVIITVRYNYFPAMLCGNCDQVCPVQIPISSLILKEIELARKVHPNRNSVASVFEKRKKLNKMNGAFRRHFFTKKLFGKNKMLYSYFKQQKDAFYNYTWMQEHGEND